MGIKSKSFSLLLVVLLVVSSLLIIQLASAQSIPKPSVPEFTLRYVAHPYDVPPTTTTTTNPYTGKTITTTTKGYHVENRTFDIIIRNQPFISQQDDSGNYIGLFFDIRFKPHYTDYWKNYYGYSPSGEFLNQSYVKADLSQSNTIVSFPVSDSGFLKFKQESITFPQGGYVDVQVKALIASETTSVLYGNTVYYYHIDSESDWSNTQTIEIGETSISTPNPISPTTTSTPSSSSTPLDIDSNSTDSITLPLSTFAAIIIVIVLLVVALLVLFFRRHRKPIFQNKPNV